VYFLNQAILVKLPKQDEYFFVCRKIKDQTKKGYLKLFKTKFK